MNFSTKLENQFHNLRINCPETQKYIQHIYADYIELNALFLKEEVSISDISDKLLDINDSNMSETVELDAIEEDLQEIASLSAEKNDVIAGRFLAIFKICQTRGILYTPEEYPFIIENNFIKLKENLSDKQKIYIFLLLCSNLNYFRNIEHELTVDFETLSFYSLKAMLPDSAIVKAFGKNSLYSGNAKLKISALADDLNLKTKPDRLNAIPNNSTQERGLDLIAWLPFSDKIPNMLIILGQCACGKEWYNKQRETLRFEQYISFEKTPIHAMFIPYAISDPNETNFYQNDEILPTHLLFDRKRILEQIGDADFLSSLLSILAIERSISDRIEV